MDMSYLRAIRVAGNIERLRKSDLIRVLIDHINKSPRKNSKRDNRAALSSD